MEGRKGSEFAPRLTHLHRAVEGREEHREAPRVQGIVATDVVAKRVDEGALDVVDDKHGAEVHDARVHHGVGARKVARERDDRNEDRRLLHRPPSKPHRQADADAEARDAGEFASGRGVAHQE